MKILRNFPAGKHRDILRQKMVEGIYQPGAGNGMFRFHAQAKLPCMDTRICSAAALQAGALAQNAAGSLLKSLLHRPGVFLHLPTVISRTVICDC